MSNEEEYQQPITQDYSEELFQKKPIEPFSIVSTVIFIAAGIVTQLTNAFGKSTLIATIGFIVLGIGIIALQLYKSRGGAPLSSAMEWGG